MSDEPDGATTVDAATTQPPAAVKRDFWILVAVINGALLSVALGVLLLSFTDRDLLGGLLLGLGIGLAGYGRRRFRRRRKA